MHNGGVLFRVQYDWSILGWLILGFYCTTFTAVNEAVLLVKSSFTRKKDLVCGQVLRMNGVVMPLQSLLQLVNVNELLLFLKPSKDGDIY